MSEETWDTKQKYHYARLNFPSEFVLTQDGKVSVREFQGRSVVDLIFYTLNEDADRGITELIRNLRDVNENLLGAIDDLQELRRETRERTSERA